VKSFSAVDFVDSVFGFGEEAGIRSTFLDEEGPDTKNKLKITQSKTRNPTNINLVIFLKNEVGIYKSVVHWIIQIKKVQKFSFYFRNSR
jgi:hypothetical protein